MKSTIARDLCARVTAGKKMPDGSPCGVPAGPVIYVGAEDCELDVADSFAEHGGNEELFMYHGLQLEEGSAETLNLLQDLPEIEEKAQQLGARLIVVDGTNSLLGDANYSTDARARSGIVNPLKAFAERNNIAAILIRNETEDGRMMGAASMADLPRAVLRTRRAEGDEYSDGTPIVCPYELVFERISGAEQPLPIRYGGRNLGRNERGWNRLKLDWMRNRPRFQRDRKATV